jgi:hypothetical protein
MLELRFLLIRLNITNLPTSLRPPDVNRLFTRNNACPTTVPATYSML